MNDGMSKKDFDNIVEHYQFMSSKKDAILKIALEKIAKWDTGEISKYVDEYNTNLKASVEREYIRGIAKEALRIADSLYKNDKNGSDN